MCSTLHCFDFQASVYDIYQNGCVPQYREMISTAVDWQARHLAGRSECRLLDLGCGTGNTTLAMLDRIPGCSIACLDGSREMLAVARKKLESFPVELHCRDLASDDRHLPWTDDTFDGAISTLVLEHLPFDEYRKVLRGLLRILKPGALMVAVEGYAGEKLQSVYMEEMARQEQRLVQAGTLSRELLDEIKRVSKEKETHYFATIAEKREWWMDEGFTEVETIRQYYCVAIMVGQKPSNNGPKGR